MRLLESYLAEDMSDVSDEFLKLQKSSIKVIESAMNGQVTDSDRVQFLKEFDRSIKLLMALNKKKLIRDRDYAEHQRRSWY